jgi:hypothetical protein
MHRAAAERVRVKHKRNAPRLPIARLLEDCLKAAMRDRDGKIASRIHKKKVTIDARRAGTRLVNRYRQPASATISKLSESGACWLMETGKTELIIVLVAMGVLLIFAIAAVVIFIRVWRKERR